MSLRLFISYFHFLCGILSFHIFPVSLRYPNKKSFRDDIDLIASNCRKYNDQVQKLDFILHFVFKGLKLLLSFISYFQFILRNC